ncbi:MAG: orotate phosphoribosyltransferase [Planctomycetes bacterium]|jgi:orotate phosphoribosyltransferase|nr:orotate phosphoribosyltransferase [Planctomycetota bacterium]MBV21300.1 orotate phosphoribosyltransferase [Planctomycetaceae bacterium]HJM58644.1 orotate phosphoribosyltransferase [Planctomycetota bacterium]
MEAYKREFIEFMVDAEVLTFGDFVTKSGRKTPYFVNTGRYRTGAQVEALGRFYASAIQASLPGDTVDVLFGPAYKGIPLVVTAAIALQNEHGRDLSFCFNRKEAKDHGEGGSLVGHLPQDGERVLIVEDVTTAGTSIRETVPVLRNQADVQLAGLIVSVDRQERGPGGGSALAEVGAEFGMPTLSIVTLDDIVEHLTGREVNGALILTPDILERIEAYRAEYGA